MGETPKRKRRKSEVTPQVESARLELAEKHKAEMEAHKQLMAEMRENIINETEKVFIEELTASARKVVQLRSIEQEYDVVENSEGKTTLVPKVDPRLCRINLDAAKFNLECFGFRGRESNPAPIVNIVITQGQAEKIERYAKLSEGFADA
jgi:hypothetical protein